ncbi:response regulator transcription factor [Papillibacter cinnamivorans]|uniref:Stage 0 sporulation protein A homolog n=1 Tax=Papillibacter cinnamivorans DSM 12816 TaxID=1122930 RepID=A0A1W1YDB7_9FIRM|nr:response regulator transcription factor [Papillibacter cinnamivorans]SMC34155.1 DNA-binding response regulator, NarL/FixJ family, contains REC and HTH domains [Papillibacter cinnamivorans DSM 12816]
MIKVAIADDQTLIRQMLSMILSQNGEFLVSGEAADGEELLRLCREHTPDVVLLDIKMPSYDGIYALNAIKSEFPETKVILLTTFGDEKNILRAFSGGADGYILKDIRPQMLISAIKSVCDGIFVAHESVAAVLRRHVCASVAGRSAQLDMADEIYDEYGLDITDRKILKYVTAGKSNREIAELLNFSEGTIKNRISRILSITGQKDRTQMAVFALKNELI